MCQTNSKKMKVKSHIGYRLYYSRGKSFFWKNPILPIGKRIRKNSSEPFHACFDAQSLLSMWKGLKDANERLHIYQCKLDGNLMSGHWMNEIDRRTVTGDYCKLVKRISYRDIVKLAKSEEDTESNMCQIKNRKLNQKSTFGYRVYKCIPDLYTKPVSYYGYEPTMPIGVEVKKNHDQFHAFKDKKSLVLWKENYAFNHRRIVIYRCKLRGNLKAGKWSGSNNVNTATGDYCTLLKRINYKDINVSRKKRRK